MERLRERLTSTGKALDTLDEAAAMPFSVIVRDGSIQRFEYCFESLWKLLQAYLVAQEGLTCYSPKRCFREALRVGLLSEEETESALAMADDRNLTSHTYIEAVAQAIYGRLSSHRALMRALWSRLSQRIPGV